MIFKLVGRKKHNDESSAGGTTAEIKEGKAERD